MNCGQKIRLYFNSNQKLYFEHLNNACVFVFSKSYKFLYFLKRKNIKPSIIQIKDYIQYYLILNYPNLNRYPIEYLYKAGFKSFDVKNNDDFVKKKRMFNIQISVSRTTDFKIVDCTHIIFDGFGNVKVKGLRLNFKSIRDIIFKKIDDKYYASFLIDFEPKKLNFGNKSIGIDLGTNPLITRSDGIKYYLPDKIVKTDKIIKKLSKINKESKKIKKLKKLNHQRIITFIHQITYDIIKDSYRISMESIDVSKELKSKPFLTKYCWGEIQKQISYKSKWYKRELVFIGEKFPSSQLCSKCGFKNVIMKNLSIRIMNCPICKNEIDRDINAAINIEKEGARISKYKKKDNNDNYLNKFKNA